MADDYPEVATLMGDPFEPQGSNFSVLDNYIHAPRCQMGIFSGSMPETNRTGMVGGYPIGEVNRLLHASMNGARSVNPNVEFKATSIGHGTMIAAVGSGERPDAFDEICTCALSSIRMTAAPGVGWDDEMHGHLAPGMP